LSRDPAHCADQREEGRGKREEGRGKREEGRGKREEGRGKREEGRGKREERWESDAAFARRGARMRHYRESP
jgi:hypothetical protein